MIIMTSSVARLLRPNSFCAASPYQRNVPRVLHSVPRAPAPEIAAFLAHEFRQYHLVDFVGAVDEARGAGGAIDPFGDGVLRVAARAIELDRHIRGLVQRVGAVELRH